MGEFMHVAIFNTSFGQNVTQINEVNTVTTNESNLFNQKIAEIDTTRSQLTAKHMTKMATAMDLADKMINNNDILSKLNANELTSVALSASSKANSIIGSLKSAIGSYASEIADIMNNPFLSDSEKKSKIKLIEDKIKALAQEATSKIMNLYLISEMMVSLSSTVAGLKNSGFDISEFTSVLKQSLTTVNTKPSDLSEASDKSEMYDIIDKNEKMFFDSNATEAMKSQAEKADKKLKENESLLKRDDLTKEERKRIQSENVIYKTEKKLFESLTN